MLLQFFTSIAAFGKTIGEDDTGLHAFLADLFDNRKHGLRIDRDDRERDFSRNVDEAGIRFQTENFRAPRIDRHDVGGVEAEILQVLEDIDCIVITLAGADNGKTIRFEECSERLIAGHGSLLRQKHSSRTRF